MVGYILYCIIFFSFFWENPMFQKEHLGEVISSSLANLLEKHNFGRKKKCIWDAQINYNNCPQNENPKMGFSSYLELLCGEIQASLRRRRVALGWIFKNFVQEWQNFVMFQHLRIDQCFWWCAKCPCGYDRRRPKWILNLKVKVRKFFGYITIQKLPLVL